MAYFLQAILFRGGLLSTFTIPFADARLIDLPP